MKKLFKKVVGYAAFALAALVPALSANAVTVYLDASQAYLEGNTGKRWDSANLYYFNSGSGNIAGTDIGSGIFKFENVPDNFTGGYLFNYKENHWNNGYQTANGSGLQNADGHIFVIDGNEAADNKGKWKFTDKGSFTEQYWTIYLDASAASWASACCHHWGNMKADRTGKSLGNNLFSFFVPKNQNGDFLFQTTANESADSNCSKNGSDDAVKVDMANGHLYKLTTQDVRWKFVDQGTYTPDSGNAPEHVYVIGSIKDNNWNKSSTPEMTKNGSKFTLSNVELVNDGDKAKFTLITKLGDDWPAVNGSNRFGPSSESDTDASTTAANKVKEYKVGTDNVGNAKNWLIAAGTYDLVFDYDALTLTITESGVTPPTPGELSWYLDDTKFTKVSDGEFTLTKNMGISEFHIYKVEGSSKQGYNYNSDTQWGWNINIKDENDRPLFENGNAMTMSNGGIYLYTIYRVGSNWKMKVVSTIAVPDNLDLKYKYDNNWQTVGMTKDGSKFTCTLTGVKKSKDYFFHFNSGSTCYQSTSDQNDAHYTNGDGRTLDFKIQDGDGKYDFKYWYGDSECDLKIEIDFSTMKVTVLRSNYTEPVRPDNQYYLLGDVNNWMNDGTYTTNDKKKEYGYGYSKAENGVRADYKFEPTSISGDDSWYVLDMSKTKTGGKLWGQFTIVQDNGVFQPAKLEENRNDGRDVINWNGNWEQWSNAYDRTSDKENYLKETVKAYKDVQLAESAGVAKKIKRSNFHLDHNLYKGVKIYFNPTDEKIFMTYEDTQDFYIYLSMDADRNDNEPAKKYVGIIKESMNSVNYTVNFKDFAVDSSQTGTAMTLCEDEQKFPNGLVYTKYWKIKIPNGIEGPAGQKFNVNIKGSKGYREIKYSTIFLNDLYIIDGLKAFAKAEDQTVESVQYRLYGYPADGDVNNLVIIDTKTGDEKPALEADGEYGWVTLKKGEYSYHPHSTSWWHTGEDESIIKADFTTKTNGFYPDIKEGSTNEYYSIPAEHAMKFIQWRIIYNGSQNVQGMRKAAGEKRLVPETLTVDRSNPNADWVLNGTHKEIMVGVATGVEDIEMEDGEISEEGEVVAPVYYNLQGVRVAEPQHGLYIKVTGNKSEKILVK